MSKRGKAQYVADFLVRRGTAEHGLISNCHSHDQVKDMLVSKDNNGASLLALAIASGSGDAFDTVLDVLTNELTEHEVQNIM